jgi:trehalose 6-phosphate synthase
VPRIDLPDVYRQSAVGLVTPLCDGMNLVAKEYVAAQDPADPGVLILSRFAGAAEQLGSALIVNPYNSDEVANAINQALCMPLDERRARQMALFECVSQQNAHSWARTYLEVLQACVANPPQASLDNGGLGLATDGVALARMAEILAA